MSVFCPTAKTTASKQEESTTSTLNATPNATSSIHTDEGKPARSTESVTSPGNQGRSSPANKSERTTPLHHVHGVHNGFAGKMFLCDSDTPDVSASYLF